MNENENIVRIQMMWMRLNYKVFSVVLLDLDVDVRSCGILMKLFSEEIRFLFVS